MQGTCLKPIRAHYTVCGVRLANHNPETWIGINHALTLGQVWYRVGRQRAAVYRQNRCIGKT